MTRTLGSANVFKETGVKVPPVFSLNSSPIRFHPKVQCICPSFADTAILGDQAHRDMLEKNYGILTVEEVSEGFMQLVENCDNGAVVIVFKVFLVSF